MKKYFIAMILISGLASPMASAEQGSYGGLSFGVMSSPSDGLDFDTGNLGIVFGSVFKYGLGMELFYAFSIIDDDETINGVDVSTDTDVAGLYALYRSPGDVYVKAKAGYAWVNVKFDADEGDLGSLNDNSSGFSYGLTGGMSIDKGSVELSYLVLPEFSEFDGIDVDAEIDMWNLTFIWSF